MNHEYWVWPLPQSGTIQVSCEWPLAGIALSTVEIDGAVSRGGRKTRAPALAGLT
jgi:hypothetical protein